MGITPPDPTIPTVDKKLGLLVASDLSTRINCFTLRPVNGRSSLTARATDSPPVVMWHDMLITFSHIHLLSLWELLSQPTIGVAPIKFN